MGALLAVLLLILIVKWFQHNELYKAGLVARPFFSLGSQGAKNRRRRNVRRSPKSATSTATATPRAMRSAIKRISTYTHDHDIAARLLQSTRKANMAQPLDWCVEKVIEDILRDRR